MIAVRGDAFDVLEQEAAEAFILCRRCQRGALIRLKASPRFVAAVRSTRSNQNPVIRVICVILFLRVIQVESA
jgi:hypothetical protein